MIKNTSGVFSDPTAHPIPGGRTATLNAPQIAKDTSAIVSVLATLNPASQKDSSMFLRDHAVSALQEFRQAEQDTAGVVRSTLGMDSAAAVYGAGLDALGIKHKEIGRAGGVAALRATFLASRTSTRRVAYDAKSVDSRKARFPNGDRLR